MTEQRDTFAFPDRDGVPCFCRHRHTTVTRITSPTGGERWELPCSAEIRTMRGETVEGVAEAIAAAMTVSGAVGNGAV